jgi:hypothetical protein
MAKKNYLNESTDLKIKIIEEGFVKNHMVATINPEPPKVPIRKKIGSSLKNGFNSYMAKIKNGEFLPIAGGLAAMGAAIGIGSNMHDEFQSLSNIDDINSKVPEFNRVNPDNIDYNSIHEKMIDYNKLYNPFAKYDANHDSFLDKNEIAKAKEALEKQAELYKDNHFVKDIAGFNPYEKNLEDLRTYYNRYVDSKALDINKDGISTANDIRLLKNLDQYGQASNSYLKHGLIGGALGGIGGTAIYYTMKAGDKSKGSKSSSD